MSIPINHHYVSRCQSDNFFDDKNGQIFVLSRESNEIKRKTSTKRLFSEDHANSKTTGNLDIDSESLEKNLKDNYEDHYCNNVNILKRALDDPDNPPVDFRNALENLTKFGIIGEARNPNNKRINDENFSKVLFGQIFPYAASELKRDLEELKERLDKTKYSNAITYSEFADDVFSLMGGINIRLYQILIDRYFLLPDVSSVHKREKINEYFNPDVKEIALVGIPLSSKLFLHSQSVKLGKLTDSFQKIQNEEFPGIIEKLNYGLYTGSYKEVACENYDYLIKFRDNLEVIKEFSTTK